MGKVYLIPDRNGMEQSMALIREYNGAFEYNDFWKSDILDDWRKQEEIIEFYAKFRTDFSQDTMHGAFLDITVHSEDRLIREASVKRVHQSMEIARRMGLRGVVFHTGILAGFRIDSYLKNWLEKNVCFFTELANKYPNQQILIENMFDEIPQELAGIGEAMKEVHNFGVCLDYAHGVVTDCPEERWVKELAPYIRHMHINDNDRQRDLHLPVGNGVINWQEYNHLIKQYGVEATVLVEVNGYEAQKKSLEYLKKHQIFPVTT